MHSPNQVYLVTGFTDMRKSINGIWLYYRRLEQGRFQWPKYGETCTAINIEQRQLQWLLSGLPVTSQTRHPTLSGLSVM